MGPALKEQLKTANALYREGGFAEAEAAYLKVQELGINNARVLGRLGMIALWNNRPKEAERHFKKIMDQASGLGKFWPFNAQLKALVAMIYYRMDRFPESAQLFDEAAGPVALGPFRDLKALGKHLALFGKESPYVIEGPEETQVEFMLTDPLPVVEVSVKGGKPLPFFIDTGGAEVVLDADLAREVAAEVSETIVGEFAGPKGPVGLGRIDSMAIGDFVVKNLPIHTVDTAAFSAAFSGLEVKGVIGTRLLMHFLGTIDYVNGFLILRRVTPASLQKLEAQDAKVVPFWLIQSHYMVTWGTVNGKGPMLFLVDTGLGSKGFTAPKSTLREAGITVDWTKAWQGIGGAGKVRATDITLDELTLGTGSNEVVEHNMPGVAMERPLGILGYRLGFRIGGLISHQFFRNYALTFDFTGMRLLLQRNTVSGSQGP